jgi:cytochrome c551/c552
MKTNLLRTAAAGLSLSFLCVPSVQAQSGQELLKMRGCMECHASAKQVWGPSFSNIGNLYKGTKDAEATMTALVLKGGTGHWGSREMPAHLTRPVTVTEAEAKQMARWILAQK